MSQKEDSDSLDLPKDAKPEEVERIYARFAKTYDEQIVPGSSYPVLDTVIQTFLEAVGENDKNMRIMDLGAGTGLAAVELKKHGFTNIDGLDLSSEMLKKAKEKNAYKNYFCEAITEKRLDIPTGTYDTLISVGAVACGYIKANAFDEILRLIKPGGVIAFTLRKDVLENDEYGYSTKFEQLASGGKWEMLKKYVADYCVGCGDMLNECYVLCYKVLKNE